MKTNSNNVSCRSSLQSWIGATPPSSDELRAMRAAVWHKQGIAVIVPEDIRDAHAQKLVRELAEKLYGHRRVSA
jgi:hypothetical protein